MPEEDCSVTMINGRFNHNNQRNRTRFRLSSDGDPKVTYKCKLDNRNFDDCEFIAKFLIIHCYHAAN